MSSLLRSLGALAIALGPLLVASCNADSSDIARSSKYSGTFAHITRDGGELREIVLPKGTVRRRITFPIGAIESGIEGAGGLTDCGGQLLMSAKSSGNVDAIFAVDMANARARFVREGHWPHCGPGGRIFFFANPPGQWRISLYVASMDDPSKSMMLLDGKYSLPPGLVFVEERYLATYDALRQEQVVFEITSAGATKVWTGGSCEPQFWRSMTGDLICRDQEGALRSQKLMKEPGKILLNLEKKDARGVLHYWPKADAILSTRIRGGWAGREYQDLIAVDLATGEVTVLVEDVSIATTSFTRVKGD